MRKLWLWQDDSAYIFENHSSAAWSFHSLIAILEVDRVFPGTVERLIAFVLPKTLLDGHVEVLGQEGSVPMKERWLGVRKGYLERKRITPWAKASAMAGGMV